MSSTAEMTLGDTAFPGAAGADPTADLPVTVIEPRPGWRLVDLRELWRYRELLCILTWRDLKVRYKQMVLGAAWAVLQPFATMVVFLLLPLNPAHGLIANFRAAVVERSFADLI